jgi:hypothetical protein
MLPRVRVEKMEDTAAADLLAVSDNYENLSGMGLGD